MKNKKIWIAIISVIALVLIIIGVTYAYWLVTETQTRENVISTGCLDIAISGEANDINLTNQFPMSDEDGKKLTPYEFTVTNNCTTSVDYRVNLESIGNESTAIKASAIKVALDNNIAILGNNSEAEPTISGAYESYTLLYGTLAGKSESTTEDTATYNLRLWIDADAPISEMNKTYEGKISVSVGQNITSQGDTLASLILADAEENNYLYTTTPDFSKTTADGEYGLYQAADDYGAYTPSNVNLAALEVEFGTTAAPTYKAVLESIVSSTEESCINVATLLGFTGLWTECKEEKELTKVYNSNTGIETGMKLLGFTSEQNCIMGMQLFGNPVSECIEKEVSVGTSYYFRGDVGANYVKFGEYSKDYELTVYDVNTDSFQTMTILAGTSMYWRIVRINGDGTIRMIYDGTNAVENGTLYNSNIGFIEYNTSYNESKYAGYTYNDGTGKEVDSTIKAYVDAWYETNLETEYGKYIADSIFCNDREITSEDPDYSYYKAKYYGSYDRVVTNNNPKLSCTQDSDKYTVSQTNGNGLLKYPVGLITADEVTMAGGVQYEHNISNTNYYLYREAYWTMSPSKFSFLGGEKSYCAEVGMNDLNGFVASLYVPLPNAVRPVINLKADSLFIGSGTITDPYKFVMN